MDPFTQYLIATLISGGMSALLGGGGQDVMEQNTAQPGGVQPSGEGPFNRMPTDPINEFVKMMGYDQQPGIQSAVAAAGNAAKATGAASQVKPVGPNLPTGTADKGKKEAGKEITPAPELEIGAILAAIPDALAMVDMLFNPPPDQHTQRAAPVAGMAGGQLVGQFAQPYGRSGNNIGQLLAALPGIR